MSVKDRITELEAEMARLQTELAKHKEREREMEHSRKAMLFMLEDLNESSALLEKAKTEWESTFDGIDDPVFTHDRDFRILRVNKAYQRYAGRPFPEIIGKRYYEVFPKMTVPHAGCEQTLDMKESGTVEEFALPGMDKIFRIRFYAVADSEKKYLFSIHVMEDITEHRRTEKKIEEEMELNTHLLMISEATAHTTDVAKLMEHVTHCTHKITGSHICLSYLWDKEIKAFQPQSFAGLDAGLAMIFKTNFLDPSIGFIEEALHTGSIVHMSKDARNGRSTDLSTLLSHYSWLKNDISCVVVIPLMGRREPMGLLVNIFTIRREFSERDNKIFQGIAQQVSIALEEARLYKESVERAIELSHRIETIQVMHEIDKGILSTMDGQDILETTTKAVPRLIPSDMAAVVLADKKNGLLIYKAGFGINLPKGFSVSFHDSFSEEVVQTGMPQSIPDLAERKDLRKIEKIMFDQGLRSLMRVPLVVAGETYGVITLACKAAGAFTAEHLSTMEKIASQVSVALDKARLVDDLEELFMGSIKSLASAIDAKSPWTAGHSDRVTGYAVAIGKAMGLDQDAIKKIELAGLLHDIGKIGTYESILDKPGRLSDEEMAIMKKHPAKGAEILVSIKQFHEIIPAIKHHHENYDGKGYPDGLKGDQIPLVARILRVADTVDAMGADRPYRTKLSMDTIIGELKKYSGTQFDPQVVKAFLKVIEKQATSSLGEVRVAAS